MSQAVRPRHEILRAEQEVADDASEELRALRGQFLLDQLTDVVGHPLGLHQGQAEAFPEPVRASIDHRRKINSHPGMPLTAGIIFTPDNFASAPIRRRVMAAIRPIDAGRLHAGQLRWGERGPGSQVFCIHRALAFIVVHAIFFRSRRTVCARRSAFRESLDARPRRPSSRRAST